EEISITQEPPITEHDKLNNLDYESSGHTGFASEDALNEEIEKRISKNKEYDKKIYGLENGTTPAGAAEKLTTEDVGNTDTPVYFENGAPVACGDSLSVDITGTAAKAVS